MGLLVFLACVLAMAMLVVLSHRVMGDYFPAWNMYFFSWLSMYGLFALNLVRYEPVSLSTWLLLAASTFGFVCGTWYAIALVRDWSAMHNRPLEYWHQRLSEKRLVLVIMILFVAGVVGHGIYLRLVDEYFGLRTLLANPGTVRAGQATGEFFGQAFFWGKFLWYANWLTCVLVVFYLLVYPKRRRVLMLLVFVIALSSTFTSGERGAFVLVAMWSSLVFNYVTAEKGASGGRTKVLYGFILVAIISLVFFVLSGLRLGKSQFQAYSAGGFNIPALSNKPIYSPLVAPYIYITANIPAFQQYVGTLDHHTWGAFTFLPIIKVLAKIAGLPIAFPSEIGEQVFVPFHFNTYTYLNSFYSDWGIAGVLLGPTILSYLVTRLYVRMRRYPTLNNVLLYGLVGHGLLLSFATNRFVSTPFWEFILLLAFFSRFVQRREGVEAETAQPEFLKMGV